MSCKTNRTIDGKRHGIWTTIVTLDSVNNKLIYKNREVYKMDVPVRTWKYYIDGKLTRKEKYKKDSTAIVTHYYENGKVEKKGKTKTQISEKESHWFYDGPWIFFDKTGKQTKTVHYMYGVAMKTDSTSAN
ncbi:hypothetical protein [Flavobacterium sp. H122]|uniref:hypothetical protein n=1 Tax=Flavobacterium sp. H122 TaxID=2529860 RepID=UPI0010A9F2D9|nr:hypothetical protein [Flavobacterium sp. H122]